ncbi:glycosyltransferase family 9 protein [Ramlibacter sp. G-1-2-2]|uniref:Glycosyltransferase family 9 protein n=1 Tax=Ramlibacter agri TaxID=2728837 RepID=A0A848HDX8_9BURK|nr:glycosyltransferase family 9 protein [Ramlibacter agri]NML45768.1 glycosyltransferase family 9 protein [Ramlibacter agri]
MRSVLVVVTRQIGDVLLTTPLVHAARERWPEAAIDVLGFAGTLGMLRGNPDVRTLIEVPARPGLRATWALARRLWRRYDLALVADPGDRAHLIGWVAARERSGLLPAESGSNWWKRKLLRHGVTIGGDQGETHVVPEKMELLAAWGGGTGAPQLVGPAGDPLPAPLASRLAPGYVVVHTPSMWVYKQWPEEHFRKLIALLALAGRQVVLTGGPGAGDRATVAAMEGAAPPEQLLDAGLLSFNQVATLLRGAALYIGPDTSVSHLAAACGTPVLAIFGPTNPRRWAPWPGGEQPVRFERRRPAQTIGQVTLLQAPLPCVPCGRAGCEDHRDSRADCLPAILPERVAAKALELLDTAHGA